MSTRIRCLAAACALLAVVAAGCVPGADTPHISSPPAPAGCITSVGPADKLVFTGCGGGITYNVSVPVQCFTYACGLIADIHGWTMDGDIEEANTGIAAIGRLQGYIVVQPSAPDHSWNASHYPFVLDFIRQAAQVWRVDMRRVHVTGFSQGGFMTYWMRCHGSDLFASAAPVSAAGAPCPGGDPAMPTLYIQGRDDFFISSEAAVNSVASFITTDGLGPGQVIDVLPGQYERTHYSNSSGFVYETLFHSYTTSGLGGHCLIGSPDPGSVYGCDQPAPFSDGQVVVDFFKSHPKPVS